MTRALILVASLTAALSPSAEALRSAAARLPPIVFYTEHSCARGMGACGNGELAVVAGDGSHYRLVTRNHVTERHPSWSADHRRIVYDRGSPSRIWEMDADGSHQHPLRLFRRRGERLLQPALSPDSRRLAASVWTGMTFRIFVYDLRSGRRKPLPALVESAQEPAWSPDGTRLALTGYWVSRGPHVVISSVDGRRWRTLPGMVGSPSWSPDGRRLAATCGGGVCITSLETGRRRLIARIGGNPAWSPDGRWITLAGGYGDIYVLRPDGTGQHRVAKRSPDQTRINLDPDW